MKDIIYKSTEKKNATSSGTKKQLVRLQLQQSRKGFENKSCCLLLIEQDREVKRVKSKVLLTKLNE